MYFSVMIDQKKYKFVKMWTVFHFHKLYFNGKSKETYLKQFEFSNKSVIRVRLALYDLKALHTFI